LQIITRYGTLRQKKTLNAIYEKFKKLKTEKAGTYGKKIKFKYFSVVVEHKNAGKIKIVFIKTREKSRR
jgi:gamma-glutamylcyclotransferase (GGCT)/AIG2-like uncharacterized protein YtfP